MELKNQSKNVETESLGAEIIKLKRKRRVFLAKGILKRTGAYIATLAPYIVAVALIVGGFSIGHNNKEIKKNIEPLETEKAVLLVENGYNHDYIEPDTYMKVFASKEDNSRYEEINRELAKPENTISEDAQWGHLGGALMTELVGTAVVGCAHVSGADPSNAGLRDFSQAYDYKWRIESAESKLQEKKEEETERSK